MDDIDRQIEELKRKLEAIRSGQDIENIENMRRRALEGAMIAGVIDNPTANELQSTVIGVGGGTVEHCEPYDKRLRVEIDGTAYYIGLYTA